MQVRPNQEAWNLGLCIGYLSVTGLKHHNQKQLMGERGVCLYIRFQRDKSSLWWEGMVERARHGGCGWLKYTIFNHKCKTETHPQPTKYFFLPGSTASRF